EITIEHSAEMMDDLQRAMDRVIALDALSRNGRTMLFVKEALQRVENGTFGTCERFRRVGWRRFPGQNTVYVVSRTLTAWKTRARNSISRRSGVKCHSSLQRLVIQFANLRRLK